MSQFNPGQVQPSNNDGTLFVQLGAELTLPSVSVGPSTADTPAATGCWRCRRRRPSPTWGSNSETPCTRSCEKENTITENYFIGRPSCHPYRVPSYLRSYLFLVYCFSVQRKPVQQYQEFSSNKSSLSFDHDLNPTLPFPHESNVLQVEG